MIVNVIAIISMVLVRNFVLGKYIRVIINFMQQVVNLEITCDMTSATAKKLRSMLERCTKIERISLLFNRGAIHEASLKLGNFGRCEIKSLTSMMMTVLTGLRPEIFREVCRELQPW